MPLVWKICRKCSGSYTIEHFDYEIEKGLLEPGVCEVCGLDELFATLPQLIVAEVEDMGFCKRMDTSITYDGDKIKGRSSYIYVSNTKQTLKIRVSDHELPPQYDEPNFELGFGNFARDAFYFDWEEMVGDISLYLSRGLK
jgi:hypothetical protein